MLKEILVNMLFVVAIFAGLLIGAKECADEKGISLWEELFDED